MNDRQKFIEEALLGVQKQAKRKKATSQVLSVALQDSWFKATWEQGVFPEKVLDPYLDAAWTQFQNSGAGISAAGGDVFFFNQEGKFYEVCEDEVSLIQPHTLAGILILESMDSGFQSYAPGEGEEDGLIVSAREELAKALSSGSLGPECTLQESYGEFY